MELVTSFYCPKCNSEEFRIEARLREQGGYLCPKCGSTFSSFESAWNKES